MLSAGVKLLIKNWSTRCAMLRHWPGEEFITSAVHMAASIYWLWEANKQIPKGVERKQRMRSTLEYRRMLLRGPSCFTSGLITYLLSRAPFSLLLTFASHLSLFIAESWLTSNEHRRAPASAASGNQYITIPCPSFTPPPARTLTKQLKVMP